MPTKISVKVKKQLEKLNPKKEPPKSEKPKPIFDPGLFQCRMINLDFGERKS